VRQRAALNGEHSSGLLLEPRVYEAPVAAPTPRRSVVVPAPSSSPRGRGRRSVGVGGGVGAGAGVVGRPRGAGPS
jgi:hypothetical protein